MLLRRFFNEVRTQLNSGFFVLPFLILRTYTLLGYPLPPYYDTYVKALC